jgi:hypothetical protein
VHQLQRDLLEKGCKVANGNPLDWYYVAKVVWKLNREKTLAVDQQKINENLAIMKENFRAVIEMLWRIIDYKFEYLERYGLYCMKTEEKINPANTLVKLGLAILSAEIGAGIVDLKLGSVNLNIYQVQPLDPEKAHAIAGIFKVRGINRTLLEESAKVLEPIPAGGEHKGRPQRDCRASQAVGDLEEFRSRGFQLFRDFSPRGHNSAFRSLFRSLVTFCYIVFWTWPRCRFSFGPA